MNSRWRLFWVMIGGIGSLVLALLISIQVIATTLPNGITSNDLTSGPIIPILIVNLLVGLSAVLFVIETGWGALRALFSVVAALLIGFVFLLILNTDPVNAYANLLGGPLSLLNRWGNWINDALALTLLGLAITLVFRAQLFSLGAEGQIYLGALAAGAVALYIPGLPAAIHIPLALAAGCAAGFLWGLLPGVLRAYMGANELVSTLMLNPIGIAFYDLCLQAIRVPLTGSVVTAEFPTSAQLPQIVNGASVTVAVFYAAVAVIVTWLIMQRTPLGYEIRMIGANMRFARYGGINTRRTIVLSMAVSGIFAGLAGSALVMGIHHRLRLGISSGLAFDGIVVALLARNKPLAVPAMALLYAYLRTGADVEAVIILLVTADALVDFLKVIRRRNSNEPQPSVTLEMGTTLTEVDGK